MKMNPFFRQGLKSGLVAMFIAAPATGWSASVTDRPLFIDAAVDHNLMFVVDDSGSMDYEVIAPEVGVASAFDSGYIFYPGDESGSYGNGRQYKTGKRLVSNNFRNFEKRYYYLRSPGYNLQYYDPNVDYSPWPSTSSRTFTNASITNAELDPGLTNTLSFDLTKKGELGLGNDDVPATVFVPNKTAEVFDVSASYQACASEWDGITNNGYCYKQDQVRVCGRWGCYWDTQTTYANSPQPILASETKLFSCLKPASNEYDDWRNENKTYLFKAPSGSQIPARNMGFAPDGTCIQRLELVADAGGLNKTDVYAALGGEGSVDDFFADQQ